MDYNPISLDYSGRVDTTPPGSQGPDSIGSTGSPNPMLPNIPTPAGAVTPASSSGGGGGTNSKGGVPVAANMGTDPNGYINGYAFSAGNNGDMGSVTMQNPYMLDPSHLNPYAAPYLADMGHAASNLSATTSKFNNPAYYDQMRGLSEQRQDTSLGNYYASRGLSGSSAEANGISNANMNNDIAWNQRQLNDAITSAKAQAMMDQAGIGAGSGVQGQYGGFENQALDDWVSLINGKNQQAAANNAAGSQMAGSGMTAAAALMAAMMMSS